MRVLILGNGKNDSFSKEYLDALENNNTGYIYICENNTIIKNMNNEKTAVVMEETKTDSDRQFYPDVVIVKGRSKSTIKCNKIYLLYSDKDLKLLTDINFCNTKITPISCGFAEKDTVCISSVDDNKANVFISREIKCRNGEVIDTGELVVNFSGVLDAAILGYMTCCLICPK